MEPLIRDGAVVILQRAAPDTVVCGEIIVFRREGKLFAHRLIEVRGHGAEIQLREKGDNVHRATWIAGTCLLGKAVEIRQGPDRRALNVDLTQRRVRWLIATARLEADLVERYVVGKEQGRLCGRLKELLFPAAVLAAPFRFIIMRILLTVYPRQAPLETQQALRSLLGFFRALFAAAEQRSSDAAEVKDWISVVEAAGAHGVVPLLIRAPVCGGPTAPLPPRVMEQVRRQSYQIALNHNLAKPALRAVTRALADRAIPYLVLKGPFLYEALYQNVFPREYEDLDIMVSRHSVLLALSALRSTGYEVLGGRLRQGLLLMGHFHLALRSRHPGWPPLELHWSLVDRGNLYRLPDAECLARRCRFGTGEEAFSILAPEDQFIFLCLHAAKHGPLNCLGLRRRYSADWFCRASTGNRLLWFVDIALFLRQNMEHLDWEVIGQRIRAWNVSEDVCTCLSVLDLLAPEAPARAALKKLQVDGIYPLPSDPVQERPAESPTRNSSRPSGSGRLLDWTMRMSPFLLIRPIRILLIGRILLPTPSRLLGYYNVRSRWLLPWLYVRHPFHMIRKLLGCQPESC